MTGPAARSGPDGHPVVDGVYRLDRPLGSGAMGAVHLATDTRLGRQVAIKLLSSHLGREPEFLARFAREATVLGRLDSPHIIPIYDHGRYGDRPYLVMQYAAGGDLGQVLQRHGPMPAGLAAEVCAQVADGLGVAHAVGVVHRDVKPANVLLRDSRLDRPHVYLCDFGVAFTEPTGLTRTGAIAGTWNYLAPERTQGDPGSPASDIYAVGCLLHELLTGRPPYTGTDVEVAMAHLEAPVPRLSRLGPGTERVNEILARTLAKDPASRFASARELRDALRTLAPPSVQGVMSRDRRLPRRRLVTLAAATAALVIVAGVLLAWRLHSGHGSAPIASARAPQVSSSPSASVRPKPRPAVTGDVDGDRRGDILTVRKEAAFPETGDFYRRDANGNFTDTAAPSYAAGATCAADADGDGRLDFFSLGGVDATHRLTVRSPTRARATFDFATSSSKDYGLLCGDFTGDGRADAAIWSLPEMAEGPTTLTISVIRHRADGSWASPKRWLQQRTQLSDASVTMWFQVGDFDADGKDDLVMPAADHGPLSVLKSTGTSFRAAPELGVTGDLEDLSTTSADLDGDGRDEILVARDDGSESQSVAVWTLRGGSWHRTRWRIGNRDFWSAGLGVTDVNGDGKDDVVALGSLDGSYLAISGGTTFSSIGRLGVGDLEGYIPIGKSPTGNYG